MLDTDAIKNSSDIGLQRGYTFSRGRCDTEAWEEVRGFSKPVSTSHSKHGIAYLNKPLRYTGLASTGARLVAVWGVPTGGCGMLELSVTPRRL